MSNFQTMFPDGKKIKLMGEDFTIMPFVLRTRAKVLQIISDICVNIAKTNPGMSTKIKPEDLPGLSQTLITAAGEKLVDIYEFVLGKTKDELLDKLTLAEEIVLIRAIMEVNDLPFLFSQVKELIAHAKKTS
jgi:hypothetical protein